MTKSERLCRKFNVYPNAQSEPVDHVVARIECLVRHIIDNDLAHIWLILKIVLGMIATLAGGLILAFVKLAVDHFAK